MPARSYALILLAGMCWAEAAEPKPRPRLSSPVAGEEKRENGRESRPALESGLTPGFRSFGDFLQAESRRRVGLEAFRETPAAPSVAATETGATSKDSPSTSLRTDPAGGDILVLPKLEITAERLTKLGARLAALEAQQSWEENSAKAWETRTEASIAMDAILNPSFLRLGSYSASGRAIVARQRVEIARWVRIMEILIEEAKTPAEKAHLRAEIDNISEIARYWE